jgi:hypothetical protein
MTPRAKVLIVLFACLAVLWLGLVLADIRSELQIIRHGLQVPRASYPADQPVPGTPAPMVPRNRWIF